MAYQRLTKRWLSPFLVAYPMANDEVLVPLRGKRSLSSAELNVVVEWKFQSDPRRRQRTKNLLARHSEDEVASLTQAALATDNDVQALLLVCQLEGVGVALGSSILMAHDPYRFTVIDVNAWKALAHCGEVAKMPSSNYESFVVWLPYLNLCRTIATRFKWSLRDVDRALFKAGQSL